MEVDLTATSYKLLPPYVTSIAMNLGAGVPAYHPPYFYLSSASIPFQVLLQVFRAGCTCHLTVMRRCNGRRYKTTLGVPYIEL